MSTTSAPLVARHVVDAAFAGAAPADEATAALLAPLLDPTQLITVRRDPDGGPGTCHHVVVRDDQAVVVLDRAADVAVVAVLPALVLRWVLAMAAPTTPPDLRPEGRPTTTSVVVTTTLGPTEVEVVTLAWVDAGIPDAVLLLDGTEEIASVLPRPWATRSELVDALFAVCSAPPAVVAP